MENQPTTLNEFQEQTINKSSLTKESASLDLVYQSSKILAIIEELNNPATEITPTGFMDAQICLGNTLRDIAILANSFKYTLGFISHKTGKARLQGFAYLRKIEDNTYNEEFDKRAEKQKKYEIAVMPEKKQEEKPLLQKKKVEKAVW